jgi:membrane AbrB-like protein
MSRRSLRAGAGAIVPAALLTVVMLLTGLLSALLAVEFLGMEPATALFAAAPGGITELAAVATSLGADGAAVTAVHLVRVLVTVALANALLARHVRLHGVSSGAEGDKGGRRWLWMAALAGTVAGLLGLITPVPAGGLVGSVIGSAVVRLWRAGEAPRGGLQVGVQALSGVVIGLGITEAFFEKLTTLGGVILLIVAVQVSLWIAASYLLSRLAVYDRTSAVLSAAPGGMGEILAAAGSAGADTTVVAFTHLVRLGSVILIIPALAALLLST